MTTEANGAMDIATHGMASTTTGQVRPLYWSIRRELWENRSLYIAPFVVLALNLFGFMVSLIGFPHRRRVALTLDDARQHAAILRPYDMVATMLFFTAFVVGMYYCLDALYGERRDRSILFWKSLPVSDRTTVIAKASIPFVVLPVITFTFVMAAHLIMLFQSSAVLMMAGMSPATTFAHYNLFFEITVLLYGLLVAVLWHAPIYAWLLLVSAWARRVTLLWAVGPFVAISILEKILFNTSQFPRAVGYRFFGGVMRAFAFHDQHGTIRSLSQLTPERFFFNIDLWIGLAFAAALLAGAVRLRRYRDPI